MAADLGLDLTTAAARCTYVKQLYIRQAATRRTLYVIPLFAYVTATRRFQRSGSQPCDVPFCTFACLHIEHAWGCVSCYSKELWVMIAGRREQATGAYEVVPKYHDHYSRAATLIFQDGGNEDEGLPGGRKLNTNHSEQ
jgi:hypothetical protein